MTTLDPRAPLSLRRLHTLFASLEFSLSSLALYQRSPEWDAVKRAVESSSQMWVYFLSVAPHTLLEISRL
jgi:hypothetical protein